MEDLELKTDDRRTTRTMMGGTKNNEGQQLTTLGKGEDFPTDAQAETAKGGEADGADKETGTWYHKPEGIIPGSKTGQDRTTDGKERHQQDGRIGTIEGTLSGTPHQLSCNRLWKRR